MKWRLIFCAAMGTALALYLVMYVGWRSVFSAAIGIGWWGFTIFCLCSLGLFVLLGIAWHVLMPGSAGGLWVFVRARMVRDSVAEVLPLSQLGGIALGVRAAVLQGVGSPLACASMIVDVTTEMVAQIAYAALGVAILRASVAQSPAVASLTSACLAGLLLATIAAGLFLVVQRRGQRLTGKVSALLLRHAGQHFTAGVSAALDAVYRSPARVALSVALHLAAWLLSAAAVWLAFRLMGAHVAVVSVLAIESLIYAIRSAAVVIPNALGVQEAAYAFLAPLFGVGPELALAVSVLKRARDIVIGVPVLLMWQAAEGRQALARSPAASE
jgi:glycosyltransferase 2 family protein